MEGARAVGVSELSVKRRPAVNDADRLALRPLPLSIQGGLGAESVQYNSIVSLKVRDELTSIALIMFHA